ncbi:MAG: 2-oxoacid:acceptor oxidoreductase family protein, partial [Candidatus Binatia bacterium]|nr:2-oxoacid:acceptor oxidoreductase family protein [Candidatus Binatia bacterium]
MMEKPIPPRAEVIFSGIGGQGILLAGLLLAEAAASAYSNVVWTPSYATRVRGGPCECTVILSQEEICSPLISRSWAVVLMQPFQIASFENRLRPKGLLLVESAGMGDKTIGRQDIQLLPIPGQEMALKLGSQMAANLVLLGAYVSATGILSSELIEKGLEQRFGHKKEVLALNREAFQKGFEFAR